MKPQDEPYSYTDAGLDGFLSRSVDDLSQQNLNAPGPSSTQNRFDFSQVSGVMGGKFRATDVGGEGELSGDIKLVGTLSIGNIKLDGENDRIGMADNDQKEFLSFRTFDDGQQGFIIVKRGYAVSDAVD